jgi:Recombination endonuclease VII
MFKNTIGFTQPSACSQGMSCPLLLTRRHLTGRSRHTNLFNVLRGIVITVMHHTTTGANPGSNRERHFRSNHAATRAAFTRGIPTVNLSKILAVPFAFVLGFQTKRTKASVRNALGEAVILDHAAHVQILNANHIKTAYQIGRDLVQMVVSRIANVLMDSSNLQSLRVPTARAFLAPRENPLRFDKFLLKLSGVLRVVNPFAVGQSCQTINSEINTDHKTSFRQRLNVFVQHQRHKVLTSLVLADCDRGWFGLERSGPFDFQPAQPCNLQTSSVRSPFERTARVFGALIVRFLLEFRIEKLLKEVYNSRMKIECKVCTKCSVNKPVTEFSKKAKSKDGLQGWCKNCLYLAARQWVSLNPDAVKKQHTRSAATLRERYANDPSYRDLARKRAKSFRESLSPEERKRRDKEGWLRRNYGISLLEYTAMVETRNGKCDICERDQFELFVDHDHANGAIRGLLCNACNTSLGIFGDTELGLMKAVNYLRKANK